MKKLFHNIIDITIKQMFKLYISVLGVYILPLYWPSKILEVHKAPRLWRCVYYSKKNGFSAVTPKSAITTVEHKTQML